MGHSMSDVGPYATNSHEMERGIPESDGVASRTCQTLVFISDGITYRINIFSAEQKRKAENNHQVDEATTCKLKKENE